VSEQAKVAVAFVYFLQAYSLCQITSFFALPVSGHDLTEEWHNSLTTAELFPTSL
jgi:hypothetical protein